MKTKSFIALRLVALTVAAVLYSEPLVGRDAALSRSSPEAQGISSEALLALHDDLEQSIDAVHSMMIVRHGHVVSEGWWAPYAAGEPHVLFSLSKSFTSTAVGLAQSEGLLSIDGPVLSFFPDDTPAESSKNLEAMRVRDLLMMSTGHHADVIGDFPYFEDENLVQRFLGFPVAHKPGTHFVYNTPGSFMLSAIVQKVTGEKVVDYLEPRLFEPLGIEPPVWLETKSGFSLGGWGLSLRTEDIAAFGQLLLQKGEWKGRRLLPEAWVELATSRQTANGSNPESDWEQGYGFQFWRCRHGFYRGDGAFGQFCIVMPEFDTVIAITSGTGDMGGVMKVLWDRLLPELRPAELPADGAGEAALRKRLTGLTLSPVTPGVEPVALSTSIAGRTFSFDGGLDRIETIRLEPADDGVAMTLGTDAGDYQIPIGYGMWSKGGEFPDELGVEPVAASGGWKDESIFEAKLCLYRTPFVATIQLQFEGDEVKVVQKMNVGFGDQEPKRAVGRVE